MKEYISKLSVYIRELIIQKQSMGYKYLSESGVLKRFDTFCATYYPDADILGKEMVFHWCKQRPGEHPSTLQGRITPIRELARYMVRNKIHAFVAPKGISPKVPRYIPYIYSDDELKRIFSQTDRCHYCVEVPYRHHVMPLFFRLLYCCGLRLSEARMIKVKDVDMEQGVITLTRAKLGKHRQIPLSAQLHERFISYYRNVHVCPEPEDWFFPGYKNKSMTASNIEKNLRKFLWESGISHCGRAKPGQRGAPNVHSFRHTFSVHCLRKWIREGKDTQAYLSVLQAYLGHASFSDTAYYLHLTIELFPDITERLENNHGNIIPTVSNTNYDNYEECN